MKRMITIAALVLAGTCVFSQEKKADRLFNRWAYADAAKCYEKAIKKESTPELNYKLGLCYQKMLKYYEAKAAYDRVNAAGRYSDPMFYYNYGLVLKNTENYEQAMEAFDTYAQMNPGDTLAQFQRSSCQLIIDERGTDLPVLVKSIPAVNDEYASFFPVVYKDGVLFTSSMKNGNGKRYAWNDQPYYDVYYASQDSSMADLKEAKQFDKLVNTKYSDGPGTFTRNYDTIYFNRIGRELRGTEKKTINVETNKIYYATLDDGKWKNETPFAYNSKEYSVACPFITMDGSRIYFSSDMPGGYGQADLYYCEKQGDTWSTPVNLGASVNTSGDEKFPYVDSTGNLYFASDGYRGYGSLDIIVARNNNGSFERGKVLKAPLNSAGDDYGLSFLDHGRTGYISSVRKESNGDADIFYFSTEEVPCIEDVADYVIGFRCPEQPVSEEPLDTLDVLSLEEVDLERMVDLRIYFDFDKSNLRSDAIVTLDSVLNYMKTYPDLETEINGHCDSRGSDAYNMALGKRRANAARQYLQRKGIAPHRLKPFSFGERQLVNGCTDGVNCSEAQHQLNRRVQFIFHRQIKTDTSQNTEQK